MTRPQLTVIHNVITTADLCQRIDIQQFNKYPWGRYDLENNYNGKVGYVKDSKMKGRVTVFLSGKMISTGAKSVPLSIRQLERSMDLLVGSRLAKRVKLEPRVRNIVGTINLGGRIDLAKIATCLSHCIFEPDQFPGIIYRPQAGVSHLIFSSGKIIVAGAKSEEQLAVLASEISHLLYPFRIGGRPILQK